MSIREATSEDVSAIFEIHAAAVTAYGPAAYDDDQVVAWANHGDAFGPPVNDPTRHVVVHEPNDAAGGEPDGVVAFGDLDTDTGEVCGVYVHPDYARRGVGSAILDHLETHALDVGLDETHLVASKNAVGFYERCGYESEDTFTHETTGGVELDCIRMTKSLSDEPL